MQGSRLTFPLWVFVSALWTLLLLCSGVGLWWTGFSRESALVLLPVVVVMLASSLLMARALWRPLMRLSEQAEAIRRFDFSDSPIERSVVREVEELAQGQDLMRDTLRRFVDLNLRMSAEDDFEQLLPLLLAEVMEAAGADAGVLYLANAEGDVLLPGTSRAEGSPVPVEAGTEVVLSNAPALLRDAIATMQCRSGTLTREQRQSLGLGDSFPLTALAFPLHNQLRRLVGAILLFGVEALEPARQSFVMAVCASAARTLERRELVRDQKALFESLIRMLAGAIDAQSPYTGGHCERVPELAKLLARAACDASDGPYADFDLDPSQWEAVHIASWLHDCGKVTTPEFVVDKATKLETIHDRIHEVRMRFEVLKRDAEIAYWQGIAQGADETTQRRARDAEWSRLDEEFAFVAACNTGGEYLGPEQQARLREIGARQWRRTLDDRLGISRDERERKQVQGEAPGLPVDESLLADKPEHRIARPPTEGIAPDNPWGFRMDVPELLYDRGELHNLTISRGTLTAEERYKINEHMVQTIIMLSRLPFPKHLRAVPEIAGGHHEKMDGTGYPKRLTRQQMSPLARMMAIADIFEALTAADRPYKDGKTLSQALAIMAKMRNEQHIDAELFDLFLRAGVYRDYAERYLRPEQIDTVDIADYLD
jgi:HD-GYP domain-containing protein (c-di-GMP phosphodiesterase class II)